MPLYIRDAEVNALAEKAQKAIGARTKTDAVRAALQRLIEGEAAKSGWRERNAELLARARQLGSPDPDFNLKKFRDEMWGEGDDA